MQWWIRLWAEAALAPKIKTQKQNKALGKRKKRRSPFQVWGRLALIHRKLQVIPGDFRDQRSNLKALGGGELSTIGMNANKWWNSSSTDPNARSMLNAIFNTSPVEQVPPKISVTIRKNCWSCVFLRLLEPSTLPEKGNKNKTEFSFWN